MDRAEVVRVLAERAVDTLAAADLTEQDGFVGRGVDSLAVIEWVLDLEEALGVELTEAEVTGCATLGELADVILAKRG